MSDEQFKRECFARWLLVQYRRKAKTRDEVEKWLKAQPDEQHMREVMRGNKRGG